MLFEAQYFNRVCFDYSGISVGKWSSNRYKGDIRPITIPPKFLGGAQMVQRSDAPGGARAQRATMDKFLKRKPVSMEDPTSVKCTKNPEDALTAQVDPIVTVVHDAAVA